LQVIEAYKIGLSALKYSISELPLNEDKVQDTLIELESVLKQLRDIENVLSQGIATSDEATESELENELRYLLALRSQEAAEFSFLILPTFSSTATTCQNKNVTKN